MSDKVVLLIDDDFDFATLVKFFLEDDTNWKILINSDAEKGFTQAKLQQPSVILLDVVMPKLNGLDIYKLLKSDLITHHIPIIFITAMIKMEKILKFQIKEDIEIIIKPFDIMTLTKRIINVCDRY